MDLILTAEKIKADLNKYSEGSWEYSQCVAI